MKSLLITEVFPPQTGGSGRWLYELYRRLAPESVVVAAGEYARSEEFDREQSLRIERMPLTLANWGFCSRGGLAEYWKVMRRLMKLVKAERPQAIHCGRVLPEGWLAWMLRLRTGLPYWVYVHGEELTYANTSRELSWMMRRVFAAASGVIANSRNTAAILSAEWRIQASHLHTLNPGVDAGRFRPAQRDRGVRERLGWGERPVVLTVGRLQKRKGQDTLIRALAAIGEQVPNVLYSIVGDGDQRAELESLVGEFGLSQYVEFRGEPDDAELIDCYQQCDLFVLPNRTVNGDFEGFGMVLVEAQACGRPVIAGDSGGTRETMQVGKTGLIVDCTRPEPLASVVAQLMKDAKRRDQMGKAARDHVLQSFDWPRLASQAAGILGLVQNSLTASKRNQIGDSARSTIA